MLTFSFLRTSVVASALLLSCTAQANRPEASRPPAPTAPSEEPTQGPAPIAQQEAETPRFDPAVVAQGEDSVTRLMNATDEGSRAAVARARLDALLATREGEATEAQANEIARARWFIVKHGATNDAGVQVEALTNAGHPLARWARLHYAESLFAEVKEGSRSPADALAVALSLTRDEWAGRRRAEVVVARSYARQGNREEAIPRLRALVASAPARTGAASVGMPLAAMLTRGSVADREEALSLYRRVATRAPKASVTPRAQELANAVLTSLPPARREALRLIPVTDRLVRAQALYDGMHHRDAEEAFAQIVHAMRFATTALGIGARCRAQMMQGRSMLRRRERRESVPLLIDAAERCDDVDVKAWSRYKAGRALAARGRRAEAMAQYALVEREAPEHRLADDALFHAALIDEAAGRFDAMTEKLLALPERYPSGDMRHEALFRLAWRAHELGRHEEALALFSRLDGAVTKDEAIRGRGAYWSARSQLALGRQADAITTLVTLMHSWPLSYYAQQANARLQEVAPARADEVLESQRGPLAPLTFAWRDELDQDAFARALALLEVKATEEAKAELGSLGMIGARADEDALWLSAALFHHADAQPDVLRLLRRRTNSYRSLAPAGRGRAMWRLAYPKAFAPLIEETAARESVPPAFVRAIAREESSFTPTAVSWAHAYGLTQVILPTARQYARQLGLRATPATLKDPATNLAIGTRFMGFLFRRYAANPALVPSAYNAGFGATDRWLRADRERPLDEFVEEISYDETRRYTRRVLQTYGVYSWLDADALPPMPRDLPRD